MLKPGLKCVIKQMYFCVPFCGTGPGRFPRRFDALASRFLTFPGRGRAGIRPRGRRGLKRAENGPGKTEENRRRRGRAAGFLYRSFSAGPGPGLSLRFSFHGIRAGRVSRGPGPGIFPGCRPPGRLDPSTRARAGGKTKNRRRLSLRRRQKITGRIFLSSRCIVAVICFSMSILQKFCPLFLALSRAVACP